MVKPDARIPAAESEITASSLSSSRAPVRVLAVAATVGGALLSIQARINGALAEWMGQGHAITAALLSFMLSLVVLVALTVVRSPWRRALHGLRTVRVPAWCFLGGLGGASFVGSSAYAAPLVGAAFLTVGIVTGQTLGALAMDAAGLGPGGKRPITVRRVAGALVGIAAAVVAGIGGLHSGAGALILPVLVLVGAVMAFQSAANGRLGAASGSPAVASVVSFAVGTAVLAAVFAGAVSAGAVGAMRLPGPGQAWMLLGGLCGAAFVLITTIAVAKLGVLRMSLCVLAGQFAGGLALDVLTPTGGGLQPSTVVAACVTVVAVLLASKR